jgi:dolichyl-phosphate beta-glucosyltransferase
MASYAIVVPCYNEAERLNREAFRTYLSSHPVALMVFVNDGSTDATLPLLQEIKGEWPGRVEVLDKKQNAGKAEAVRDGLLWALRQPSVVYAGFWDADLATPLEAVTDLLEVFHSNPTVEVVFGSRVKLLGRKIKRNSLRHYLGRIFATCASLVLDLPIYDTQCGAKFFLVTPALTQALQEPFCSRWIFDVELIARLLRIYAGQGRAPEGLFYEFPLHDWKDVAGSKIRPTDFVRATRELLVIRRRYASKKLGRVSQRSARAGSADTVPGNIAK